jgi:hypothetical protein
MGNFFTPVEIRVRYELKRLSAVVGFDNINGLSGRVGSLGFANQEMWNPLTN